MIYRRPLLESVMQSLLMPPAAIHGLAAILIPLLVMGLLRRSAVEAAAATLAYLVAAFYAASRLPEALRYMESGARIGALISAVVIASIYFYNVYRNLGYEEQLAAEIKGSEELRLALATFFAGFIEGVSGFGIPVAVVAPLLYASGVPAEVAVASVLVGHTWAVPFASMGVPTAVLAEFTGVSLFELSSLTGIYMSFSMAVAVLLASRMLGTPAIRAVIYSLMSFIVIPIALALGPITGSVAGIVLFTIALVEALGFEGAARVLSRLKPYILLTLVLASAFYLGYRGLTYAAALIALTGLLVQVAAWRGGLKPAADALEMAWKPAVAITLFAAAAQMAGQGGFMLALAREIAGLLGGAYTYMVPLVGALGAYFTGSNTTSNVVFAVLQDSYARLLGHFRLRILALQNTGGGIGSMTSPSKIAVGASTTKGEEIEPEVFSRTARALPLLIAPQVIIALLLPILGE